MSEFLQEYSYGNMHPFLYDIFSKYSVLSDKILDVGSGSGAWGKRLLDNGYDKICLIDGFLEPDIQFDTFTKSDFTKVLPYADCEFDCITCLEVIEHVENQFLLINEMLRIVKKGGKIILSTPNINTLIGKILFFLTGNIIGFKQGDGKFDGFTGHINPFYLPSILSYFDKKMKIVGTHYSVWKFPFTGRTIPFKNKYFGNTVVFTFEKL